MRLKFSRDTSLHKQRELEELVKKIRSIRADESAGRYEFLSRQAAKFSRYRLAEITNDEAIILRIYGRLGLVVNFATRDSSVSSEPPPSIAQATVDRYLQELKVTKPDDINRGLARQKRMGPKVLNDTFSSHSNLGPSITRRVDDLIEKYSPNFENVDYLYRIGRSAPGIYSTSDVQTSNPASLISPGDIIADKALWSSTIDSASAIFRYSQEGDAATLQKGSGRLRVPKTGQRIRADEQEEIFYIIEHNREVESVDISGFKFARKSDQKSSSERLIKSRTPFRVVAVGDYDQARRQRIVVLRPLNPATIDFRREVVKNPFDGIPVSDIVTSRMARIRPAFQDISPISSSSSSASSSRSSSPDLSDVSPPPPLEETAIRSRKFQQESLLPKPDAKSQAAALQKSKPAFDEIEVPSVPLPTNQLQQESGAQDTQRQRSADEQIEKLDDLLELLA